RRSASRSRSRGAAVGLSSASRRDVASGAARAARAKNAPLTLDRFVEPLTFRADWGAAAAISASVAGGSKLWSVRMFRHMSQAYPWPHRDEDEHHDADRDHDVPDRVDVAEVEPPGHRPAVDQPGQVRGRVARAVEAHDVVLVRRAERLR